MIEVQLVRLSSKLLLPKRAIDWVSLERRAKISRFHRPEDGKRSLIAELLMRRAAALRLKMRPDEISFARNPYGRPYLANIRHFKFNVSHSGKYVAIVVGRRPVGVDIERVDHCNYDVAKRFFSPAESEYLHTLPTERRNRAFTTLWTLKESYTKAEGKGLLIPFQSFGFELEPVIRLVGERVAPGYLFESMAVDDYCLSICHREPGAEIALRTMSEESLYDEYAKLLERE